MWTFIACSARIARSSLLRTPSGSTSASNLARNACLAALVRAARSVVRAQETCAPNRPRSAAELVIASVIITRSGSIRLLRVGLSSRAHS